MKKKLLVLSLVFAMLLTSSVTAFASDIESETGESNLQSTSLEGEASVSDVMKAVGDDYAELMDFIWNGGESSFKTLKNRIEKAEKVCIAISEMTETDLKLLSEYLMNAHGFTLLDEDAELLAAHLESWKQTVGDTASLYETYASIQKSIESKSIETFRSAVETFEDKYYDVENEDLNINPDYYIYFAELAAIDCDEIEIYDHLMSMLHNSRDFLVLYDLYTTYVENQDIDSCEEFLNAHNDILDRNAVAELFQSFTGKDLNTEIDLVIEKVNILYEEEQNKYVEEHKAETVYNRLNGLKGTFIYGGSGTIATEVEKFAETVELFETLTDEELSELAVLIGVKTGAEAKEAFYADWNALSAYMNTAVLYAAFTENSNAETAAALVENLDTIAKSEFTQEMMLEVFPDIESAKADAEKILAEPEKESVDNIPTISVEVESYTVSSGETLTLTGSGEFTDFEKVLVDGDVVAEKHYTVKEGSTILTFTSAYLDTLKAGKHIVEMVWTTGSESIEIEFVEESAAPEANTDQNNEESTDNGYSSEVPKTDDNLFIWISLAALSALSMAVLTLKNKVINK